MLWHDARKFTIFPCSWTISGEILHVLVTLF
jgi:hypothetical protein